MLIFGIVAFVIGGGLMFAGRRQKGLQESMQQGSVVPIKDAKVGATVELYGTVVAEQPLKTPFSQRDCVYYEYTLEREVQNRDSQGRMTSSWDRVASDQQVTPFVLRDSSGNIAIRPEGARIDSVKLGEQYVKSDTIPGFLASFTQQLTGYTSRVHESALLTNANAYVMGTVVQDGNGLAVAKGSGKMLISHKTEAEVERSTKRSAALMNIFGIILGVGGIVLVIVGLLQK